MISAYTTMSKALAPTRIYNISAASNIYKELLAYSYALNIFSTHIDEVFADSFITTSSADNIETLEKMFGYSRSDLSLGSRKIMLIDRFSVGNEDFSRAGLDKFIHSLGIGYFDVSENPSVGYIAIQIYVRYSDTLEKWMTEQIKNFLPVNCTSDVFFGGRFWDTIDDLDYSFSYLDNLNLTWEQIDELE